MSQTAFKSDNYNFGTPVVVVRSFSKLEQLLVNNHAMVQAQFIFYALTEVLRWAGGNPDSHYATAGRITDVKVLFSDDPCK